jgi:hypothetical protein
MNIRQFYKGKAIGSLVVMGLVVIVWAGYSFNNYIYEQKQGENSYEPYRGTLTGQHVCLPRIETAGPQTMECALGLLTDGGEYYALDFNLLSQSKPQLSVGDRISAAGIITPVERLSTDHWRQYPIEGIFSVTDSLQTFK